MTERLLTEKKEIASFLMSVRPSQSNMAAGYTNSGFTTRRLANAVQIFTANEAIIYSGLPRMSQRTLVFPECPRRLECPHLVGLHYT